MPLAFWPAVSEYWGHPFFRSMRKPWRLSRLLLSSTTTSSRTKALAIMSMPQVWEEKVMQATWFPAFGSKRATFRTWPTWACWLGIDQEQWQQELNATRLQMSSWRTTVPHGNFTVLFEVSDWKTMIFVRADLRLNCVLFYEWVDYLHKWFTCYEPLTWFWSNNAMFHWVK